MSDLTDSPQARAAELADARNALDSLGVPIVRDGATLTMAQRINHLGEERETVSDHLSDVWLHLDSWARGEAPSLEFVQDACKSILRHQSVPGWKKTT